MESEFCKLLVEKRKEKHLNKRQTAALMGVTPMYYARFEKGDLIPTKHNLYLFASFLEMDQNELWQIIQREKEKNRL